MKHVPENMPVLDRGKYLPEELNISCKTFFQIDQYPSFCEMTYPCHDGIKMFKNLRHLPVLAYHHLSRRIQGYWPET